jgi:hypothetical protein
MPRKTEQIRCFANSRFTSFQTRRYRWDRRVPFLGQTCRIQSAHVTRQKAHCFPAVRSTGDKTDKNSHQESVKKINHAESPPGMYLR